MVEPALRDFQDAELILGLQATFYNFCRGFRG